MTRIDILTTTAIAVMTAAQSSLAGVVVVPDDYPTINEAMAAIVAWDTVLVRSGVYREDILGLYPLSYRLFAEDGPESTTVIGSLSTGWIDFGDINIEVRGFTFREGSGLFFYNASGTATITISDCIIERSDGGAQGGAIDITSFIGTVNIESCVIRNNRAVLGGGLYAILGWGQVVIDSSLIVDNVAVDGGGGIYARARGMQIQNSTVARNHGGGLERHGFAPSSNLTVSRTIIGMNPEGFGIWCEYPAATASISCSDVWGNEAGNYGGACPDPTGANGNISLDPLFCDPDSGDYHLRGASPCAPGASPPGCGLIGALPVGCVPAGITMEPESPGAVPLVLTVTPTPFSTVAQVVLPGSQTPLLLMIYDAHGRLLQSLPGRSESGRVLWQWTGVLPSSDVAPNGLYFLRAVSAGTTVAAGKALLLR